MTCIRHEARPNCDSMYVRFSDLRAKTNVFMPPICTLYTRMLQSDRSHRHLLPRPWPALVPLSRSQPLPPLFANRALGSGSRHPRGTDGGRAHSRQRRKRCRASRILRGRVGEVAWKKGKRHPYVPQCSRCPPSSVCTPLPPPAHQAENCV
ncbi:hypothetical protein B0H13DRAFT_2063428 [Mycena leptocephala]|nr:hypothetical protein B0H13DRAFT_2063428 [Mycena leptocephala]